MQDRALGTTPTGRSPSAIPASPEFDLQNALQRAVNAVACWDDSQLDDLLVTRQPFHSEDGVDGGASAPPGDATVRTRTDTEARATTRGFPQADPEAKAHSIPSEVAESQNKRVNTHTRKHHKNGKKKANNAVRRQARREASKSAQKICALRHVQDSDARAILVHADVSDLKRAPSGYVGGNSALPKGVPTRALTLKQTLKLGLTHIKWDGR